MTSIFDFTDYLLFLNSWIADQPRNGHGIKGQWARHLGVSSTMVSFFLNGKKNVSMEQASDLADFLGLSDTQADYFFLLVEYARAGHHRLKDRLLRQIKQEQTKAKKISHRVQRDKELSETEQAIFYSSWVYTGIRNLSATGEFRDAGAIARRLNLPIATVQKAIQFLIQRGLCVESKGRIKVGPTYTHIDASSPLVNKHRQNWRLRGIQQMDLHDERDLFYVAPMSLSEKDAERIRERLLAAIEEIIGIVRPSPSETVRCLNIDWFKY